MSANLELHASKITEKLLALEAAIDDALRAVAERRFEALRQLEPSVSKREAAKHLAMS